MALKASTTHLVFLQICFFLLLYSAFTFIGTEGGGSYMEEWCIADEQTPDEVLQSALDWACGKGGADCSMIQLNKPCFLPNTMRNHASYAFNSYWQKTKNSGGHVTSTLLLLSLTGTQVMAPASMRWFIEEER